MLAGIFLLAYAIIATWIAGTLFLLLIEKITREKITTHPVIKIIAGLCWTAVVLQLFHLFGHIGIWAHLYFWLLQAFIFLPFRKECIDSFPKIEWPETSSGKWLLLSGIAAALINIVGRAGTGDIGDYHLQAIRWIEEYATVPGVGNVRRQLGNNSNWFLLHAFTGMHFLGLRSVYTLNALLLVLAVFYFLPNKTDKYPMLKFIILLYVCAMSFRKYTGAVTNDYVITMFSVILFSEWVQNHQKTKGFLFLFSFVLMVMVTFKLSAIALFLPVGWIVLFYKPGKRVFLFLVLAAAFILIPWAYTTYLQSGYLVYPLKLTAFTHPDWQMPSSLLDFEIQINLANERAPGMPAADVLSMPFSRWFPIWLRSIDAFSLLLLSGFIFSLLVWIISLFRNRNHVKNFLSESGTLALLLTCIAGMVIWFTQAPAIRFVFGYLVFFIAITAAFLLNPSISNKYLNRNSTLILCILLILGTGIPFIKNHLLPKNAFAVWVVPEPYTLAEFKKVPLINGYVFIPDPDKQCWDAPLPCSGLLNPGLEWRGERMSDGFHIKNE